MKVIEKKKIYEQVNEFVEKDGVVFLGSDFLYELPLNELKDVFDIESNVHNRSVCNLQISNVENILEKYVYQILPKKIFLNIGETDIKNKNFNLKNFISQYEWLLYNIHNKIRTTIYIISVMDKSRIGEELNTELKKLSEEVGCVFIDLIPALSCEKTVIGVFDILRFYIRTKNITFVDAMRI